MILLHRDLGWKATAHFLFPQHARQQCEACSLAHVQAVTMFDGSRVDYSQRNGDGHCDDVLRLACHADLNSSIPNVDSTLI